MEYYRDLLEESRSNMVFLKEKLMVEENKCPQGRLTYALQKGRRQYYVARSVNGKYVRTGTNKNIGTIKDLARKEFLIKTCKQIDYNLKVLKKAIDDFKPFDPEVIINSMTAAYRTLPEEYFFTQDGLRDDFTMSMDERVSMRMRSHEEWAQLPYEQSNFKPEERNKLTSRGQRMRSKTEVMIAEKLYEYGVPFRYEQLIDVGKWKLAPDFTFEDRRKEEFYWEYCGMMDNIQYVGQHKWKMNVYQENGILPWENLIVTYDKGNNINMAVIDSVIRNQIIPRL